MRRGDLNHNSGRLLTALVLLFTLATGNAWGNSNSYYTGFKATGGATGNGYVYSSTSSTATPEYDTEVVGQEKSDNTGSSSGSNTYYAWAKAVRGNEFKQWSADKASGSAKTGEADAFTVTSNTKNGTTTGVVTAQWDTYTKVNVTYNASDDGEYTVAYSYNTYDATSKTITAGDAEGLGCTINSDNGSKTIGSYYNDVITLTSTKGDFQGWYKASDTTNSSNLLSTDNPYTYVAPQSGTGSVYAKYPHVEKNYGRLTASIAAVPYSMPAGGMIFISKEEAATPSYSENAQTVDNVGMGTTSLTYYLKAQPTDKRYVFRGWYSNAQCAGKPISTNKEYTYSFTASSTNSESPTEGNVYAAFDFNLYYMEVQAQPATPGLGMVLVSDTKLTSPAYTEYSNESSQFAYAYRLTHTTDVYVYAKPKYGYKLSGWYSDAACTQAVTVASDGKYTASSTASTDPMNPDTITLYAKFVPATDGDKISLTYKIPDKTKGEYTASVLDITEVDDEYVWTFTEVYNSVDYTADKAISQHKTDVLRLEAAPKVEYGVTSWSIAGTTKPTPSQLYETSATETGKAYGVAFGDAKPFLVSTNSTQYATFTEALSAVGSSGQITVVQNAYVPAGNYTIPSEVTLLVPCDAEYTCYKKLKNGNKYASYATSWTKPTGAYCTLTLASGAHIILNGEMSVSAKMNWAMGNNGSPSGLYGFLKMNGGSTLTLKSGSNLYAWGYIAGEGTITAESGSHTYEGFQVTGYRGGNATSGMAGNKYDVFPMNQYYIQNIENKITFQAGALEHLFMGVTSGWGNEGASIDFIGGPNSSNTLFLLKSGATLTKWYDPSKDRQKFELRGDAALDQIVLDVADVSSADYVLPLCNNMDLDIASGTTTINYDVAIFPDVNIRIRQDAEVTIKKNAYVYDADEWDPAYAYAKYKNNDANTQGAVTFSNVVRPIEYTTTTKYSRTSVTDANIMVEGVLKVASGGNLYTTASGANIIGGNGGNIILEGTAPSNGVTYQAVQSTTGSGNTIHHYDAITVNPAKLHNADDSYLATAGAQANDKFLYSQNMGQWLKNPKTVTWNANGGTTEATTMAYSQGQFLGELPAAYRDGYTLAGWFTAASGGTQIAPTTKVTANATYYAHWTPKQYDITYMDQGKAAFSSTHIDEPNAHPTKHTYGTTTTLNGANNKTGYDFGGWHTISNCKESSKVTSLSGDAFAKDITLYAKWTPQEYTITYKDKGDAAFSGTSWESAQPTTHTYGTATTLVNPSKAEYVFDGWFTSSDCSGSALTTLGATAFSDNITLYAKWTPQEYTITYKDKDNAEFSGTSWASAQPTTHSYGTATTLVNPSKENYVFDGWFTSADCSGSAVTTIGATDFSGDFTLYAKWTPIEYTITWKVEGKADETTQVEYDAIPVYPHEAPYKAPGDEFIYIFNGWSDGSTTYAKDATLPAVTGETTYTATFGKESRPYTITWLNCNGEELHSSTSYWDETPAYPTHLGTPTYTDAENHIYRFTGWTPELHEVNGLDNNVYTATYERVDNLEVAENETIEMNATVTTTTVRVEGTLQIASNKTLTTDDLILEATSTSSGEIIGDGELTATNAYFDFSQQEGFKARTWYSVAVPWQVAVPHNAPTYTTPCDIYAKKGDGEFTQLKLGSTIDLIYYDGNERATNGPGDDCWRYVEDDSIEQVMMPGKAYMFLLLNEADTLRFVRKGETGLLTETTNVALYDEQTSNDGKDANWNGIANPATYHAYLNGIQENPDDDIQGYIYMHDNEKGKGAYEQVDMKTYKFVVGQAAYVQAPKAKSITVLHTLSAPGQAPLRVKANSHHVRYDIHIGQEGVSSDHVVIRMDENKEENCYIIGKDIVKFGVSDFKPQLWIDRYDAKLGMNTMASANNTAVYPLGVFVPQAGEYTITPDQSQITNGDMLYLTYDGRIIWNLTYAPYSVSLEKGTNSHYGIKLVRSNIPAITTDIDQSAITNDKSQIQKVLMDDQVYILRGGEIYTTTGQKVK